MPPSGRTDGDGPSPGATSQPPSLPQLVMRLARLKMTVFSAVTYATGVTFALRLLDEQQHEQQQQGGEGGPLSFEAKAAVSVFSPWLFCCGYLFVLSCQLTAHFYGELHDLPSDKLNVHGGPFTGGSKVLVNGLISEKACLSYGRICLLVAMLCLRFLLPSRCLWLGVSMVAISHQYSAPPFQLNHNGLGEAAAALVMNVLLPLFSALVQSAAFSFSSPSSGLLVLRLAILVVPAALLKASLFLVLNLADRRADWAGGKYTLPVLLGDETTALLVASFNAAAYVSAVVIYLCGWCSGWTMAAVLCSAPAAASIARNVLCSQRPAATSVRGREGYRVDGLVLQCLKHSPFVVLGVFGESLAREILQFALAPETPGLRKVSSLGLRCLPLVPFLVQFFSPKKKGGPPPAAAAVGYTAGRDAGQGSSRKEENRVVVVGGGVGGLTLALCLKQLGIPYEVLETRAAGGASHRAGAGGNEATDEGADLALWPAAIQTLKELGVGRGKDPAGQAREHVGGGDGDDDDDDDDDDDEEEEQQKRFWAEQAYAVDTVYMTKAKSAEEDEVLRTVNMKGVVEGSGEAFVLIGRAALMAAMRRADASLNVRTGVRALEVQERVEAGTAEVLCCSSGNSSSSISSSSSSKEAALLVSGRVVVGCDGINSLMRRHVTEGKEPPKRYGGEVCYRGLVDLGPAASVARSGEGAGAADGILASITKREETRPRSMSVTYGDGIRFSWGVLNGKKSQAFWFVKQQGEREEKKRSTSEELRSELEGAAQRWPEPVKSMALQQAHSDSPGGAHLYRHAIHDRPPLPRWSSSHVTLVGDACHAVTPNNGQGACMAIEDALVLSVLLREYWSEPDGHIEAFYLYERARRRHTTLIYNESYKQMKLGQLRHPLGVRLRETLLRNLPSKVLESKLRKGMFEIQPWLQRFRHLKKQAN